MKYWIYIAGEVPGQYEPQDLIHLPGFTEKALICPVNGDPADRRWQPAGVLPEIARLLKDKKSVPSPAPEAPAEAPVGPADILDQTNVKLFRHIAQLMKQIEAHREDRSLITKLQKTLFQTQEELRSTEQKLAQVEKTVRELEEHLAKSRMEAQEKERLLASSVNSLNQVRLENKNQSLQIENLQRQLAEKDLAATKSMAALVRVEQELGQLVAPVQTEQAPFPKKEEASKPEPAPVEEPETKPAELLPVLPAENAPKAEAPLDPFVPQSESPSSVPMTPPWKEALDKTLNSMQQIVSRLK